MHRKSQQLNFQRGTRRTKRRWHVLWFVGFAAVLLVWFSGRGGKDPKPAAQRQPAAASNFVAQAPASLVPSNAPVTADPADAPKPAEPKQTPASALTPAPAPAPARIQTPPPPREVTSHVYPRPVSSMVEAQIALARQGISCGPVDGLFGEQTKAALSAFQTEQGLPATGELDSNTCELLLLHTPACVTYSVTSNDLARLQPLSASWVGKSQQTALDYENILELVAEKFRTHPNYIRKLNPRLNWNQVTAGTELTVPDTDLPELRADASFATISLSHRLLQVFDSGTNLLAHFPCSIAQRVEKRPAGELRVTAIAPDPNYTFDPAVFPESQEARSLTRKLILPPGPNNPVGTAWISLDRPGYGIHGTPQPEQVGRTESHGCFRLANWNAAHLLKLVRIGMPIYVMP